MVSFDGRGRWEEDERFHLWRNNIWYCPTLARPNESGEKPNKNRESLKAHGPTREQKGQGTKRLVARGSSRVGQLLGDD